MRTQTLFSVRPCGPAAALVGILWLSGCQVNVEQLNPTGAFNTGDINTSRVCRAP